MDFCNSNAGAGCAHSLPVVLGCCSKDIPVMDLAGDRVAGCDSLAYLQLAWQVIRDLGAIAHLLILSPHLLPPCL